LVFKVEFVFSVTHRVIESHRVAMVTIGFGLCVTSPNYNVPYYSTIRCQYSDRWNYAWFALSVRLTALLFVFEISSSVMTPCLIMNWGRSYERHHWVMPVIERQALGHTVVQAVVTGLSPGRDRLRSQVRSSGIRSE